MSYVVYKRLGAKLGKNGRISLWPPSPATLVSLFSLSPKYLKFPIDDFMVSFVIYTFMSCLPSPLSEAPGASCQGKFILLYSLSRALGSKNTHFVFPCQKNRHSDSYVRLGQTTLRNQH